MDRSSMTETANTTGIVTAISLKSPWRKGKCLEWENKELHQLKDKVTDIACNRYRLFFSVSRPQ